MRVRYGEDGGRIISPFGRRLREARLSQRMTKSELAERSGVDRGYIGQLELGHRQQPSFDVAERLAKVLGLEPHELFAELGAPVAGEATARIEVPGDHLALRREVAGYDAAFLEAVRQLWRTTHEEPAAADDRRLAGLRAHDLYNLGG